MQSPDFSAWLTAQLPIWMDRPLRATDQTAADRINEAENRLGTPAPLALKALYGTAGEITMLMQSFQRFLPPEHWRLEAGKLVFLEENQGVCEWACDGNGAVWQGIDNGEGIDWYAESLTLQDFLKVVLPYQLAQGGWPYTGMTSTPADQYAQTLLIQASKLTWPQITQHNGLTIYGNGTNMLWGLQPAATQKTGPIFVSCLHEPEFKKLLKLLKFDAL